MVLYCAFALLGIVFYPEWVLFLIVAAWGMVVVGLF